MKLSIKSIAAHVAAYAAIALGLQQVIVQAAATVHLPASAQLLITVVFALVGAVQSVAKQYAVAEAQAAK